MGNFTRDPKDCLNEALGRGAVALHVMESVRVGQGPLGGEIRRGVPVLDRDLTLMGDIAAERARSVIARFLGDGPLDRGFEIVPHEGILNDFTIKAGTFLVNGVLYRNPSDLNYMAQYPYPPWIAPPEIGGGGPGEDTLRTDTVYLDVWLDEVNESADKSLGNFEDVDEQTSVRLKASWRVGVAEGARETELPEPPAGHTYIPLAIYEWNAHSTESGVTIESSFEGNLPRRAQALATLSAAITSMEDAVQPMIKKVSSRSALPGGLIDVQGDNLSVSILSQELDGTPLRGLSTSAVTKSIRLPYDSSKAVTVSVITSVGRTDTELHVKKSVPSNFIRKLIKAPGLKGSDIAVLGRSAWLVEEKSGTIMSLRDGAATPLRDAPKAARITVGPRDVLWIVTPERHIYRRSKGVWERMPGLAVDIAAGADGTVYKIGAHTILGGHELARWTGRGWEQLQRPAERVAVGPHGDPWIIDKDGHLLFLEGEAWTHDDWRYPNVDATDVAAGVSPYGVYCTNRSVDIKGLGGGGDGTRDIDMECIDPTMTRSPSDPPLKSKGFTWQSVAVDTDYGIWGITKDGDVFLPNL